ncbi:hypothetical protein [Streptomyces sp. NPDC018347]|uniref:hypothetical protein n=1 Tax=Streptomyces sp. NPDC018347 TaxID=3157193 RepID=UPI0033C85031
MPGAPHWYPLRLTTPVERHVFGGRVLAGRPGRTGLPPGPVAETWEVSDVDGEGATVTEGPPAGRTLRELPAADPAGLLGDRPPGPRFPLPAKFIDGTGALPVHLHPDDDAARRLEGEPNGKTEAWHVLHAEPGATAPLGVRPGVERTSDLQRHAIALADGGRRAGGRAGTRGEHRAAAGRVAARAPAQVPAGSRSPGR